MRAPFATRNVLYLRISAREIVPVELNLDQRLVRWMNKDSTIIERAVERLRRHFYPSSGASSAGADMPAGPYSASQSAPRTDECDEFRLLFYFQDMEWSHGVLLKHQTLEFPDQMGLSAVPLAPDTGHAHANAPLPARRGSVVPVEPSPGTDAVKEPTGSPIDLGDIVPGSDDESAPSPLQTPLAQDDDDVKVKPKLRTTYSGFDIRGRELVLVVEPTPAAVAADPALFVVDDDDAGVREQHQLRAEARTAAAWNTGADPGASVLGSVRAPGVQREGSTARGRTETPLFRGLTPGTDDGR
ncbi:hypothetical protein MSPP1_001196 [Malassezia sp. CBS 17886]|nr:hypothetical protein MSPP1_001196 [Malassezia sp. CBS 17886]